MNNIPYNEFVTHWVANSKSHQDSGQMVRKVRMSDLPTIDSPFCIEMNKPSRRYSILHEQKQIFTSGGILYFQPQEKAGAEYPNGTRADRRGSIMRIDRIRSGFGCV